VTAITDEMLMAYADGELDKSERANVDSYLAQSSEGAGRLAVFAATGRDLASIFERPMLEPVPQRLLDAVAAPVFASQGISGKSGNVVSFQRPSLSRPISAPRNWSLAAAACLTVLAVGAGSYWFKTGQTAGELFAVASSSGVLVAHADLASALDTTPSKSTVARQIGGAAVLVTPVFTFASAQKDFCRQFEVARAEADSIRGVACRDSAGQWGIKTHVAFAPMSSKDGQVKPAGPSHENAEFEATVDSLIAGNVLGGDEEAALIKRGWTTK
jgi:surface antigen